MASSRVAWSLPEWIVAVGKPCLSSDLASTSQPFLPLQKTMMGGVSPPVSIAINLSFFWFSLRNTTS